MTKQWDHDIASCIKIGKKKILPKAHSYHSNFADKALMSYFFSKFIPTDTNQQMIDFTLYNERAANAEWLTDINFLFFIWFVLQCTPWEIDWKLPPTMSAMSKRKKQDKISR